MLDYDNKIIGSVNGKAVNNSCLIGRLMVHPHFQRRGLGIMLMNEIEKLCKTIFQIKRFELFTGELSFDNINLYQKIGYKIYKTEPFDEEKNIVFLEKYIVHE